MSWSVCSEAGGGDGFYGGAVDLAVALLGEDVGVLDGRELAGRLGDVERTIRKLEAVAVSIVAEADRREVFRDDGHVSVRGWVKASLRVADVTVTHRVRTAKLVRDLPACADALAAGRLGVDQVRELARLHANPRCGDQLAASVDGLIELATTHTFEVFKATARQWEQLADADGAHRDHDGAHTARTARAVAVGDEVYLEGRFGTAQGAAIAEVLERFTQAEFDAEWDDLRARLGDDACPHLLERSDRQRRADAVAAIFAAAATALPDAKRAEPVVNIIIDQAIYDAQLAAMTGDSDVAGVDLTDLGHLRCHTTSGLPIDPADAVAASLIGHIRRVIVDADGVIIDLGRRSRCSPAQPVRPPACKPPWTSTGDVCGPAAGTTTARSTTPNHGPTADQPTCATPARCVPATTGSRPAATEHGATPTASGTPNDPTAPRSKPA